MRQYTREIAISAVAVCLVVVSWTGGLDHAARTSVETSFHKAVAVYALARSLNGAISVAQGTELAVQPVGVGVSFAVGQILDPLNDLIERFSWLVLAALASLGTQLLLMEIFAEHWASVTLTVTAAVLIAGVWTPAMASRYGAPLVLAPAARVARLAAAVMFVRFALAASGLLVGATSEVVLHDRQDAAVAELTRTSSEISDLNEQRQQPASAASDPSLLERLGALAVESGVAPDLRGELAELKVRAEAAIGHVIDLIVIYVVEAAVLPLAFLLLAWFALKGLWRAQYWHPRH